jgi:hypothetical protein
MHSLMAHTMSVMERAPYDWMARCRCGWTPDPKKAPYKTRDMVMDEVRKHETIVERARRAARWGGGTLKSELAHYRAMADNVEVRPADRAIWKQLADELESRLGRPPTPEEQPELPLTLSTEE